MSRSERTWILGLLLTLTLGCYAWLIVNTAVPALLMLMAYLLVTLISMMMESDRKRLRIREFKPQVIRLDDLRG